MRTSLVAQMVKNLSGMLETQVQFLGGKGPLEKEMATYSMMSSEGCRLWSEATCIQILILYPNLDSASNYLANYLYMQIS